MLQFHVVFEDLTEVFTFEEGPMASVCDLCGKKPSFGMNLSHSHRRTKRRWNPNIQRVRALVNGTPKRLNVCTSCVRAGRVTKPARSTYSSTTS
jgi:large subunit ribosomal protein L28